MSRPSAPKSPLPDPGRNASARGLLLPWQKTPSLGITNRQRAFGVDLRYIRRIVQQAMPLCLEKAGPLPQTLGSLPEVAVSIISPSAMSRIHLEFLGLAGPTDVITFPYGEIVVCAAIAADNAARYGNTLDDELALYIIHGLLHLNGFDDLTPPEARRMKARQAKILNAARRTR